MKEKQAFERIEVSRDEALSMFEENKFKVGNEDGGCLLCCRCDKKHSKRRSIMGAVDGVEVGLGRGRPEGTWHVDSQGCVWVHILRTCESERGVYGRMLGG